MVVPNQKDLKLDKYHISKFRFRELKNFCLQYREMKDKISEFTVLGAISYNGTPSSGKISDPTFQRAAKLQQLKRDVRIIEQTAMAAGGEDYQSLLTNVTNTHMPYEYLCCASTRKEFYDRRRYFFFLLDQKE